jgi:hypothetical protein
VADEHEHEAITEMMVLKAEGRSLRAIAQVMTAKGFKISHETVAAILRANKQQ